MITYLSVENNFEKFNNIGKGIEIREFLRRKKVDGRFAQDLFTRQGGNLVAGELFYEFVGKIDWYKEILKKRAPETKKKETKKVEKIEEEVIVEEKKEIVEEVLEEMIYDENIDYHKIAKEKGLNVHHKLGKKKVFELLKRSK